MIALKENKSGVLKLQDLGMFDNGNKKFLCLCPDCFSEVSMWASHFYRGSNSCECKIKMVKESRIYSIWTNMKSRCSNPNTPNFTDYGGRGISVCKDWLDSFSPFEKWALENGYADTLSIDRIDVNGGYSPSNCRWATLDQQARNKRNSINVTLNGLGLPLVDWAEKIGVPYKTAMSYYYSHKKSIPMLESYLLNKSKELRNS